MNSNLKSIRNHYVIAFFFVFVSLVFSNSIKAQGQQKEAKIVFEKTSFNYGTISAGEGGEAVFKFKNEGSTPLVISNVVSSCGCTKPKWNNQPIEAGKQGEIRVTYNTNIIGDIKRSVTVTTNDKDKNRIVLVLTGKVVKAK
jgi:Protein of unknown function (DUF1573).